MHKHDEYVKQFPDLSDDEKEEAFRNYFHYQTEKYLNESHGSCLLASLQAREIVAQTLAYHDGKRYYLHSYVIMPNHVHVLFEIVDGYQLQDTIKSIKQFSATQINRLLGRSGNLWQRESFDHMIRSRPQYDLKRQYIKNNPRNCPAGTYTYWEAENVELPEC